MGINKLWRSDVSTYLGQVACQLAGMLAEQPLSLLLNDLLAEAFHGILLGLFLLLQGLFSEALGTTAGHEFIHGLAVIELGLTLTLDGQLLEAIGFSELPHELVGIGGTDTTQHVS